MSSTRGTRQQLVGVLEEPSHLVKIRRIPMGENEPLAMFKTLILKMIKSITHEIKIVMCMEAPALAIRDC